jgi:hypothetical protein
MRPLPKRGRLKSEALSGHRGDLCSQKTLVPLWSQQVQKRRDVRLLI